MECSKYEESYAQAHHMKDKPEPKTKGEWFVLVADYMSNDDVRKIADTDRTSRDRKFETYQFSELFPDGNIKEVLASYSLSPDLAFNEQCIAISQLPKQKNIAGDIL